MVFIKHLFQLGSMWGMMLEQSNIPVNIGIYLLFGEIVHVLGEEEAKG